MEPSSILRIIFIITGLFMLGLTVTSLARRRMNESFCLAWGVVSVCIILAGCLLRPSQWNKYLSDVGLVLILLVFFCLIYAAYFMSLKISELTRKNTELAIQISLLNAENERILKALKDITGKDIRDL